MVLFANLGYRKMLKLKAILAEGFQGLTLFWEGSGPRVFSLNQVKQIMM